MNYAQQLSGYRDPKIGLAILDAIEQLFRNDIQLLEQDASERSIASKIAQYLPPHFPDMHIDVEYNRMGDAPKTVKGAKVYPDIIVHKRGTKVNILAIEIKKDSNPGRKDKDIEKLSAYRNCLGYEHALFLRFAVKGNAGILSECEWVGT